MFPSVLFGQDQRKGPIRSSGGQSLYSTEQARGLLSSPSSMGGLESVDKRAAGLRDPN